MNARDKAAIRLLIESVPVLLIVGLLTNIPSFGWPTVLAGFVLLAAAIIVGRSVWPLHPVDSPGTSDAPEETPRDSRSDTVALFVVVGITMMVATWLALRFTK